MFRISAVPMLAGLEREYRGRFTGDVQKRFCFKTSLLCDTPTNGCTGRVVGSHTPRVFAVVETLCRRRAETSILPAVEICRATLACRGAALLQVLSPL